MKRLLCVILLFLFVLSFCGCGSIYFDYSKETKAYNEAIATLFNALDNKNTEALYNLFSPAVREQDKDLREQIEILLSVYQGPTDEIGWDGALGGSADYEDGKRSKDADACFPVRSGDKYFWFYMKVMYENTFDEKQIGVTQLEFYTADEYCILEYDEEAFLGDSVGLSVYAQQLVNEDIRCIYGNAYKYSSLTAALNIEEVKDFFKNSNSFAEFKSQFGEPNAENVYIYYELPMENGKVRYLQLCEYEGVIHGVEIVDDFDYIETVFQLEE